METQGPSIGGEVLLNIERGTHLVGTSKRSTTHQLRVIQSQLLSLMPLLSLQERERVIVLESSLTIKITGVQWNLNILVFINLLKLRFSTYQKIQFPFDMAYCNIVTHGENIVAWIYRANFVFVWSFFII